MVKKYVKKKQHKKKGHIRKHKGGRYKAHKILSHVNQISKVWSVYMYPPKINNLNPYPDRWFTELQFVIQMNSAAGNIGAGGISNHFEFCLNGQLQPMNNVFAIPNAILASTAGGGTWNAINNYAFTDNVKFLTPLNGMYNTYFVYKGSYTADLDLTSIGDALEVVLLPAANQSIPLTNNFNASELSKFARKFKVEAYGQGMARNSGTAHWSFNGLDGTNLTIDEYLTTTAITTGTNPTIQNAQIGSIAIRTRDGATTQGNVNMKLTIKQHVMFFNSRPVTT